MLIWKFRCVSVGCGSDNKPALWSGCKNIGFPGLSHSVNTAHAQLQDIVLSALTHLCDFCRDSSYAMYAFVRLGFLREASRFLHWIESRCDDTDLLLNVSYGIRGETSFPVEELTHLAGPRAPPPTATDCA